MNKLFYFLISTILMGCSGIPREDYISNFEDIPEAHVDLMAVVEIVSGVENSAYNSTLMGLGGVYVPMRTGGKQPTYDFARQQSYATSLARTLNEKNMFRHTYFKPHETIDLEDAITIQIRFNETYVGDGGWPTKINATVALIKSNEVLVLSNYEANSGSGLISSSCMSCVAGDIAEKKLNDLLLMDLSTWINSEQYF